MCVCVCVPAADEARSYGPGRTSGGLATWRGSCPVDGGAQDSFFQR